jgi:biotin carboxyl carrier protein
MKMLLKIKNESFDVEIGDLNARPILATVNGEVIEVMPELEAETAPLKAVPQPVSTSAPVTAKPATPAPSAGGNTILAPIPGVIEAIKVREGDDVEKGQELLILEAMKMKNSIRATRAGKIARILVSVGDQVPHNQALIEFAD